MTKYEAALDIVERDGINFINMKTNGFPATSIEYKGDLYICLDEEQLSTMPEKLIALLHEMGHCKLGALYKIDSGARAIERIEYRADRWVVLKYFPKKQILNAFRNGCVERWSLAEYLDVPEWFVDIILEVHRRQGWKI